jgi:hypothetical protein
MRQLLLLVISFFVSFSALFSQVTISGGSNVNGAYPTLAAAITALNGATISGSVTVDVIAGHTETLVSRINMTATGTAVNTITIQKSGGGANPLITAYTGTNTPASAERDGMFSLEGSDWVTIDGIDLQDNPANVTVEELMEYGYGLFKSSDTNGCQNVTIRNCAISLSRNNQAAWTGSGHFGSSGIVMLNCTPVANTNLTVTSSDGSNSFNKFYSNTIQQVHNGIALVGFAAVAPFDLGDTDNEVGGNMVSTGNSILNFGGGTGTATQSNGIYATQQRGVDISYNTINNNNGAGSNHTNILRGIFMETAVSASLDCNFNNITIVSGATTSQMSFIQNGMGATPDGNTVNINNNTVTGSYPTATSGTLWGIYNTAAAATVSMSNNTVMDVSYSAVGLTGTGTNYMIYNTAANAATTLNIENNIVSNYSRTGTSGGTTIGIFMSGSTGGMNVNVIGNTVDDMSIDGTGTTSTMYGIQTATGTISVLNNTVNNLRCLKTTGTGVLYGIYNIASATIEDYSFNTVTNLTHNGTGTTYGIYSFTTTGNRTMSNNTVHSLSTGGTTIAGLHNASSSPNVFNNKVYNIESTSSGAPTVSGILQGSLGTAGNATIFNNYVGDLRAPNANTSAVTAPSVRGINFTTATANTTLLLAYNTIHINATSIGTNFGTAGVFQTFSATATTANLTMQNNIIVNNSTPNGTGRAVAFQRSGVALNNYNESSNNNLFYAGTPGPSNVIYFDGTNVDETISAFKCRVDPRETQSVTENPSFLSLSGASPDFLHINPAIPTRTESGGIMIVGIDDDYDGDIRQGSPGYAGLGVAPDIGADEGNFIVIDVVGPQISYTPVVNTICQSNIELIAEIVDASGVNVAPGTKPRLWFKKSTEDNVLPAANNSTENGWKWVEASNATSPFEFTFDYSLLNSAIMAGDIIEYFIVAQDLAVPPNVGTNTAVYNSCASATSVALDASLFPVTGVNSYTVTIAPGMVNAIAAPPSVCIINDVTLSMDPADIGAEYQWESSPAGAGMWTPIPGATAPTYIDMGVTSSTDYRVIILCNGVPVAGISPSAVASVVVSSPQILTTTDGVECGPGPVVVTLEATASVGADIFWYENETGGMPVGSGGTFNTPPINNTTIYYVAASEGGSTESAAKPTYLTTPNTSGNQWGLVFDVVNSDIVINSVEVYSVGTGGSMQVELRDNAGVLIETVGPFAYPPGTISDPVPVTFPLNLSVPVGTGYRIVSAAMTGALIRETSGNTYPYVSTSGNVVVTSGFITNPGSATYYWFYNWQVSTGCETEREAVTATVINDAPICPADLTVCISEPAFELEGAEPVDGVYSGAGVSAGIFNPAIAGPGNHIITYTICSLSCTFNIFVEDLPNVIITFEETSGNTDNDGIICEGASVTLTATGGGTYAWSNGETTASIVVSPASSNTYGVTVTSDNGCVGFNSATVTVNPNPTASIIPSVSTICNGEDIDLTASGGNTYEWSNGDTGATITVSPNTTTVYVVTVTDINGCTDEASATVNVDPGATITNIVLVQPTTCISEDGSILITVSGNGPFVFTWDSPNGVGYNPTSQNQVGVSVGTYFLTITDANGCTMNTAITLVGPGDCGTCPVVGPLTADPDNVCLNDIVDLEVTGLMGMNPTYGIIFKYYTSPAANPYSGGTVIATIPNNGLSGGGTSASTSTSFNIAETYYIYAILTPTPLDGTCRPFSTTTVVANPDPVITISITENSGNQPNDGVICQGASVTLTATTGNSYLWNTGETTQQIVVFPAMTTTYNVVVTDANGCSGNSSINIVVNTPPTVTISGSTTICNGQSTTLTANGGIGFLWSTGATTQSITVAPASNTTYSVTATDVNGCTGVSSVFVTVVQNPTVNQVANQTYCAGQVVPSIVFSGSPMGVIFNWTRTPTAIGLAPTAGTGNIPTFTATNAGTTPLSSTFTVTPQYTSMGVTCNGTPMTFTITINPTPTVNPVNNIVTCAGSTVPATVFSGSVPGTTYNWSRTPEPIGLAPLSGTGNVPSFVATNPGMTAITSTFTVTPVYTSGGVSCPGQPITFTIRVEPAPTALCRNITIQLDANGNATITPADINNGSFGGTITISRSQFDCSNVGNNIVILTVTSPCNTTSTCTSIVTVEDNMAPVITCPPSISVTLDPGLCCTYLAWADATATDNCPLVSTSGALFTTSAGTPGNFFNSFAGITFDVRNETGGPLTINGFRVPVTGSSVPATFNVYYTTTATTNVGNQANPAAWTLMGTYTTPGLPPVATAWNVNTFTQVNIGGLVLAPGQSKGIYVLLANYPTGGSYRYTDGNFTATDGTFTILSNGYGGTQVPFNNTFFPRAFVGEVQYGSLVGGLEIVQISGPESGEEFCKDDSPWEVVYEATDGSGNTATCSFDIEVRDYPNPTNSLACNDHVNISVDENCEAVVNADMILEGGPYSCYDDYRVELRLNGVLLNPANMVNWNHVGRTLEATVIDPNGNRCWGTILVEDKFAPNLVCEDAFAECGDDITPCASTGTVFIPGDTIQFPASFSQHGGGTAYSLSGNTLPGGVYFNLRNNSGGDLAVTGFGVRFGDPAFGQVNAPQTLQLYTAPTFIGNETNPGAWTNVGPAIVDPIPPHFQTGTGPLGQARLTNSVLIPAGETRGFHIFGATACPIFNYFNNTGPFTNGPWTCTGGPVSFALLGNLFQAGASSMPNIQVNTGIQGPAPCLPNGLRLGIDAVLTGNRTYRVNRNTGDPIVETCSDVTLTYSDQIDPAGCQGQYWQTIIRNWIATDGYGNVSTCAQNINIAKTSLNTLCEDLRDYDDMDLPAFDCDGNWLRDSNGNPDPSVVGGPGGSQSCNIQCAYNDINVPLCGPTSRARKILRRWTCVDWCEPVNRIEECEQIIKVKDMNGPSIVLDPTRDSLTALPYTCFWDVRFARPTVSDNCSTNETDPLHNVVRISISGPGFDGDFYRKVNGVVTVNEQFFPRWINVQQGLPRLRLPVGDHTVIYRAEDACGNVTELPVPLIIRDIVPPVAICEKFRVASLGPDCRVRIPATSFDDGSYDNCGIVSMQVARMTTSTCYTPASGALVFRDSVDFCCVDITATEAQRTVMFRAIDAAGNSNTCMVIVEVQDKLLPVVVCPPDVTIDCRDHFGITDAELEARFGAAVSTDNCAGQTGQSCFLNVTVVNSLDLECRQGTITRVYTATDAANNVGRCTQRITVVNNFPFDGSWYRVFTQIRNAQTYPQYPNGPYEDNTPAGQKVYPTQARANLRPINTLYPTRWDLVWPADLEVDFCGQALSPDSLASNPRYVVGSKPYVHREDFCAQVGMTYDEWEFDFDAGCKKIIRLWKVIDWCQPQTVFNPWMWEQVIKVIDTEGPEITAGPFNFCIIAENCTESVTLEAFATDNCAEGDQLRWDWEIFLFGDRTNPIRNTVPNLRGNSLTLTRVFPTTPDGGPAHIIKYIVEDGCSNKTTREVEIRVRDCKKPTPICYNGLAVDLMPTSGMADVAAILFNAGSYDNCTVDTLLRYRIERLADGDGVVVPSGSVLSVDCEDLGSLEIRFWVIDEFGNADFCETYLLVQNNMGADCDDLIGDIAGLIFTESTEGVGSVRIDVKSSGTISRSVVTNEEGEYLVNVPLYNNYTITPYRNDNPSNGVTTTDILLIQRHILGIQPLSTPYNLIAADANKSGSITAGDLVEIRKVILGKSPMFANNTSWRFVAPEYIFDDPTNAHAESFPENRVINPLLGNMSNESFYGIKIGDVNGSVKANSQSITGSISRSRTFEFNVEDVSMTAGNEYTVSFRAADIANVLGYQFTLNFIPEVVDFIGFEAGALKVTEEHFGFTMLKDGMITTSWNTSAPLTIDANDVLFTMTFRAKASGKLSEVLSANSRFTAAEAISLEGAEIGLELVFNTANGSIAAGTYELYQNVPNPFANETMINFSLPEAMDAVMTVFDVSGKVVKQINGSYAKGLNGVRISKEELPAAGVLYYQLEAGSFKATKKMIIIE